MLDRARRCLSSGMAGVAKCLSGLERARASTEGYKMSGPPTNSSSPPPTNYVSFGGASGAEFRNNPHVYPGDYGAVVRHPEAIGAVYHFINTKGTTTAERPASPYLECPCTSRRTRDTGNNTIDGCDPSPAFHCNNNMENNTGCSVGSYMGGVRCCENGVFLAENPRAVAAAGPITVWAKFTFTYELSSSKTKGLKASSCCDVTGGAGVGGGGFANIEYDIPACEPGTPPAECVHQAVSVQPLDVYGGDPDSEVELVYAVGHVHASAVSIDLFDDMTNEHLCRAELLFGSSDRAGDENGYLTGILPCVWGPSPLSAPKKYRRSHPMRTVVRYNSTAAHTGVMGLWLLATADVHPSALEVAASARTTITPRISSPDPSAEKVLSSLESVQYLPSNPAVVVEEAGDHEFTTAVLEEKGGPEPKRTPQHPSQAGLMVGVGLLMVAVAFVVGVVVRRKYHAGTFNLFGWRSTDRQSALLQRPGDHCELVTAGGTFRPSQYLADPPF